MQKITFFAKIRIGDNMKITLINPQGYCKGVKLALDKLSEAITSTTTKRPIYILGEIIHNDFIVNKFIEAGAILLPEGQKTKEEHLEEISCGTVIFQAHGSSQKAYEIARKKGFDIIDATCPYVNLIHKRIIEYGSKGYAIIYVGKKNHSETIASLNQGIKVHLVESPADIESLKLDNPKIYITNQTTLSQLDLENIFEALRNKFPQAIFDNKICDATTKRQKAVLDQDKVDLCIVVGDKKSSNSKRLFELASINNKAIFISSVSEIKDYDFTLVNSVSITSGASTPSLLVDDVVKFLESLPKNKA